ncbi:hypothetical protein HaLaN_16075 [Haematococcus lacustris]|uniref:Uncharacterized protein n=1 Tax=Haematococcus lacustris TaxID=44745 RepID=A0A699ZCS0_HAELA|nr:hypothetical protein HaLaN_16075 [Haematococcus lacustris]
MTQHTPTAPPSSTSAICCTHHNRVGHVRRRSARAAAADYHARGIPPSTFALKCPARHLATCTSAAPQHPPGAGAAGRLQVAQRANDGL